MSDWNRGRRAAIGGVLIVVAALGIAARVMNSEDGGSQVASSVPAARDEVESARVVGSRPVGPTLMLPPVPATQWGELTFSAEGFQPGEAVSLLVEDGGTMKEIGRAEADAEGKVRGAKLLLPSWLESGSRPAQAVGASSRGKASATLRVRAKELWINLNSYTLQQASKLGFVAGGFEPGDRIQVYLTRSEDSSSLASQKPLATASADEAGNTAWIEAEVPLLQPGKYTLLLKGESTSEELKAAVDVTPLKPELELSPWSGLPGGKVNLNAKGFLPREQVEVFLGTSSEVVSTFAADQYGGLWGAGPVLVPMESRGGPLAVTLRGKSSGAEVSRNFAVVAPHPWAELSSYSGFAGFPVMARGGGFAAGERVSLHVGSASSPAVAEVVTNDGGFYQALGPARVPDDAETQVAFVVVGETSGVQAQAVFKVMQPFAPERPRR